MTDKRYVDLGDKTPLEYAKTPAMDSILSESIVGSVNFIPPYVPYGNYCGSYYGNLAMLGYKFIEPYAKVAPVIAKFNSKRFKSTDYAVIAKLIKTKGDSFETLVCTTDACNEISSSRIENVVSLLNQLDVLKKNKCYFEIYKNEYLILIVESGDIDVRFYPDERVVNNKRFADYLPYGKSQSFFLEICKQIYIFFQNKCQLGNEEFNMVHFYEGGYYKPHDTFFSRHGFNGTMIAGSNFLRSIGQMIGLKVIAPPHSTGDRHTDFNEKLYALLEELADGNSFIFLHINATDDLSHHGDLLGKVNAIENIDEKIVMPLIQVIRERDCKLMITTDHNTFCSSKSHERGFVPFLIYDKRPLGSNKYRKFTEAICNDSMNVFLNGDELFNFYINN